MAKLVDSSGNYLVDGSGNNLISADETGTPPASALVFEQPVPGGVPATAPPSSSLVFQQPSPTGQAIYSGTPSASALVFEQPDPTGTGVGRINSALFTGVKPLVLTMTPQKPAITFSAGLPRIYFTARRPYDG